jgi:ribonucleoside-diphosphate reductase alpha chain
VYRYIYENGGKGVTVYRDGTRSKQVLTTRADNAEFSEMDEDEAAEAMVETIQETFGGIEGFLDNDDVQDAFGEDLRDIFAGDEDAFEGEFAKKQARPDLLHGVTQRIDTGYGKLYVTINEDPERERPFELFANTGNSGGFTGSFTEALAKTISVALRSGVDPEEIADKLQGIRSPKVAWDKGEQVNSIPDAFGTALRRYLDGEIDRAAYPQQQHLTEIAEEEGSTTPETDGGSTTDTGATADAGASTDVGEPTGASIDASAGGEQAGDEQDQQDATQSLIEAGESPECPDCGSMSLYFSEGCKTCESCGWSEC